MIELKEHITNNSIENDYSKSVSLEHRKKFAQFCVFILGSFGFWTDFVFCGESL